MGQAIGNVLTLALGVAISPMPIIAVVLMLATPRGKLNGPAFVLGWIVGVAVVGAIVLLVAGGISASANSGGPKTWVSVLKLIVGLLLVLVAVRQWRGRPQGDAEPVLPGWMKTIDSFTPIRSAGLGAALAGPNPKNLLLTVAAGAAIAQAGISTVDQVVTLAIFIAIATTGPGIPLGIYYALGSRSEKVLGELRDWMVRNNQAIMSVLCIVIAAKLIGDAITGFTA
jgi:threonine/homoserine/homoserine lactone efflux protein